MKRSLAATALFGALVLAGCGQPEPAVEATAATDTPAAEASAPAAAASTADAAPVASEPALPAAPDAPTFAVIYPGGTPSGPATVAQGPAGPGGIIQFTTDATPEAVVAFYRERAEAAGLKSINTMNRGDSAGYAAGDGANGRGKLLSVVATRVEGEPTSVQLDWTAGR